MESKTNPIPSQIPSSVPSPISTPPPTPVKRPRGRPRVLTEEQRVIHDKEAQKRFYIKERDRVRQWKVDAPQVQKDIIKLLSKKVYNGQRVIGRMNDLMELLDYQVKK